MKGEPSSLLNRIKSKYILHKIFSYAYENIKSVLKLIKYNKDLSHKLEFNFKDNYKSELRTEIKKEEKFNPLFWSISLVFGIFSFITFLVYIIIFYVRGTFNIENLKQGYNKSKKKFVDFMNNYILLAYFGFNIARILIAIFLFLCKLIALKGYIKLRISIIIFIVDLTHLIAYIIKYSFTGKIIKEEIKKTLDSPWFYSFDFFMVYFICPQIILIIISLIIICFDIYKKGLQGFDDSKVFFLNNFKGINIIEFELPSETYNLNNKNAQIFKKENVEKYKYSLNENQINLIRNINDIRRRNNNITLLNYVREENLPEFIINEKTELIFNGHKNIFKLSSSFYIFKYPKNEFQNLLNNSQILNIITIDELNEINIIEQNNIEFISVYKRNNGNNINRNNNDINSPRIQLDINTNINIITTEDKLNVNSERLSVSEITDSGENEIGSIRNIKINKNVFEEK